MPGSLLPKSRSTRNETSHAAPDPRAFHAATPTRGTTSDGKRRTLSRPQAPRLQGAPFARRQRRRSNLETAGCSTPRGARPRIQSPPLLESYSSKRPPAGGHNATDADGDGAAGAKRMANAVSTARPSKHKHRRNRRPQWATPTPTALRTFPVSKGRCPPSQDAFPWWVRGNFCLDYGS